jgi:hypothetical protein
MIQRTQWLAWALVVTSGFLSWMVGCSDLQEDCELLVNCPQTITPPPPPQCEGQIFSATCDPCMQANCCQEVSDCLGSTPCGTYCMFGIMPAPAECNAGQTGQLFGNLATCIQTKCATECGATSYCNPVTHAGCPNDGTQCELVFPGIFACVPPSGAPAQVCQSCNFGMGPYCGSGLRCEVTTLQCARYCCSDLDCGTGRCELNQNAVFGYSTLNPAEMVGLCLILDGTTPACDAPGIPPPSGGTCFSGYTPPP